MAKKKQVEGETVDKFQAALDKLNKSYGSGSVLTLNTKVTENYEIISSGSTGFNHITLGVGGFVKGKLYELRGWESSGKSTICGHAVAECQKAGGKVLYIDGEHAVDKIYFEALGVNTNEMLIAQPSNGEEGFNIALELIQTGEIDLVIIDSDSSLIPKKVIEFIWYKNGPFKDDILNDLLYHDLYLIVHFLGDYFIENLKINKNTYNQFKVSFIYKDILVKIDYNREYQGNKTKIIKIDDYILDLSCPTNDPLNESIQLCFENKIDYISNHHITLETTKLLTYFYD